ncbi:MAG: hypothetical protein ACI4QZ_07395 [Eubacteriales bacterium]
MKANKRYFVFTAMLILATALCFSSCGKTDSATNDKETFSSSGATDSIEIPDTDSPDTDINPDEIILPNEDDFSNPDFVIEKGVLVKYLGESAVVSVPDTVGEIGEYAFSHSSSPEVIVEIKLGKNVGKISPKAFFGLDNLVKIDVSSNGYFYYSDNVLKPKYSMVDLCGLSYFFISEENYFDFGMFYENELAENPQIAGMDKSGFFTFKEAVFTIDFFGHDGGLCKIPYAIIFGRYMEFLTHDYGGHLRIPCCAPTARNHMILADDVYIFTDLFDGEFGSTWCISENGIYENHSADYGTILRFSLNDEGTLCYEHYAGKYYHPTYVFDVLAYCVSRDEFCCEYGTVEFSDEGPIFTPERTFTAEEKYDLEKNFNDWRYAVWEKNLTSLDELIEQNAQKYERYNPDVIKKKFKKG